MRFVLLLIMLPVVLFGQKQYHLSIVGVDSLSTHKLSKVNYTNTFPDTLSLRRELHTMIEAVKNDGFLTATIDSTRRDSTHITAFFTSGENFNKGTISINHISAQALAYAHLKKTGAVSVVEFISKRSKLVEYYENNGYPFASVRLDSIKITTSEIDATARLDKGNLVQISAIEATDNVKIAQSFLFTQIGIKIGDEYDESKMKNMVKAINELPFLELAGHISVIFRENNTVQIKIPVKKKAANKFDGLLGFAPNPTNNAKLLITGKVSLELNNTLGYGEYIAMNWQKLDALSQNLLASYTVKYLWGTAFGNDFSISMLKKDTTFQNTEIVIGIPYYFAYNKLIRVFYGYKSSTILQTSTTLAQDTNRYANTVSYLVGIGAKLWDYDYIYNPRKGYSFEIEGASGNRNISAVNDKQQIAAPKENQLQIKVSLAGYIPITAKTVFVAESKSALLQSKNLNTNELFYIGGTQSLRGFNENAIACSAYTIVNVEYRYLFQKNSNVYAFYNQAYYENQAALKTLYDHPYGFGVGLNFQNKSNIFTIAYALGSQFGNQIKFGEALIHFGYINKF